MRRRYIAALAVAIPVGAFAILKYFFPLSYGSLSGYMVVVAIAFKSALLSFWAVSKLKIIAFLKGLTLVQGFWLLVKRWFLDNVFAKWLKRNIIDHLKDGMVEFASYFKAINWRSRVKNLLLAFGVGGGALLALYMTGSLTHILIFTELKVFVISISKTALLIVSKIFGFMLNSWLSPILEVFALSFLLSWLEKKLGSENWLIKTINRIGEYINRFIYKIGILNRKYVDPVLNDKVSDTSQKANKVLEDYVRKKKIEYEYDQFERLEKQILDGHIDAYHSFKGMDDIRDKKELYTKINEQTNDHLCIIGYISRNKHGEILHEDVEDSFYHDIFILEGVASSERDGVMLHQEEHPDHTDFWVLNTSRYSAHICSHSGIVPRTFLPPHSVKMIKTDRVPDWRSGDVYAVHESTEESVVPIDTGNKAKESE